MDVARICSVLNLEQADSIRNGMVAFYSSRRGEPKELKKALADNLDKIEKKAQCFVKKRGMSCDLHRIETTLVQDSAWVAAVLNISKG